MIKLTLLKVTVWLQGIKNNSAKTINQSNPNEITVKRVQELNSHLTQEDRQ